MDINFIRQANRQFYQSTRGLDLRRQGEAGKANVERFAKLLAQGKAHEKKLKKACIEMESLLVKQMLSVMRKAVPKTKLIHGGFAEEVFTDMLDDEYAMSMSRNHSFGLAKVLYSQLSGGRKWNGGQVPPPSP